MVRSAELYRGMVRFGTAGGVGSVVLRRGAAGQGRLGKAKKRKDGAI